MANLTFQVHQIRVYLRRESGVGRADKMVGEFPATMHGLRRARACAELNTYGQEPGRIAPKAHCIIVAASDGEPVKLHGHEVYDDRDSWLNYFTIERDELETDWGQPRSERPTKTSLFATMIKRIEAHIR